MMYGDDAHTVETDSGTYGPDHVFHVHNGYATDTTVAWWEE